MDRRPPYCTAPCDPARAGGRREPLPGAARQSLRDRPRWSKMLPAGRARCCRDRRTSTVSDDSAPRTTTDSERHGMSTDYSRALGARLRAIRNQQGLSLQGVEDKSHGRWKAVVVGSYERGDRAVTVQRLSELAVFYGVPVSELLPDPPAELRGHGHDEDRAEPGVTGFAPRRRGRSPGPLRLDDPGAAPRLQRQGAQHPRRGPQVAGDHLRHEPRRADQPAHRVGVLSPGMEGIAGNGDEDDELNPNWERRRAPR